MPTTALLTDFSIPEIFQFIENGRRSGRLKLTALPKCQTMPLTVHYIWAYQGRIVAAANNLDQQGLISLMVDNLRVSDRLVTKLAQLCPNDQPLGFFLKNQFVLNTEQLEHLFQVQISQKICPLFNLNEGQIEFTPNTPLPAREMTGLAVPATLLSKYGLLKYLLWNVESCSSTLHSSQSINTRRIKSYEPLRAHS